MKNFLLAFVFSCAFLQASLSQTIVADTQTVDLDLGWSIFSTYINPFEPSFDSVFSGIIQQNPQNIVIMKDDAGGVFFPYYGINTIGDFIIGEGYLAKMSIDTIVEFIGTLVNPQTQIYLPAGWSYLGYLSQNQSYPAFAISELINTLPYCNLIIFRWEDGTSYFPPWGWGQEYYPMYPGDGFQIKLFNPTYFSYPPGI